jgi:histidine triad (HIT) family protein
MNNKKMAGQLVAHAHIHVIPRFPGDRIKLNWMPKKYKTKEIDEFKDKIKSFL